MVPILLSENTCGWTKKYTSPYPIFTRTDIQDLTGKVAIVTGANTGIGYYTALELAKHGATVIVAARNPQKGMVAAEKIRNEIGLHSTEAEKEEGKVINMPLNLSSLQSVKDFATMFEKLDIPLHILVLNAGIMKSPGEFFTGRGYHYGFETTDDGFESHIGVNHIGHFYLTQLLTPVLKKSAPSRVVSVSSLAELGGYETDGVRFTTWKPSVKDGEIPEDYEDGVAYGQSKLANILFAREYASRMVGTGVTAYSCHPGTIKTELGRYMITEVEKEIGEFMSTAVDKFMTLGLFTAEDGALTQLHLSTTDTTKLVNGGFYHPIGRFQETTLHPQGSNVTLQKMVWTESERLIVEAGF